MILSNVEVERLSLHSGNHGYNTTYSSLAYWDYLFTQLHIPYVQEVSKTPCEEPEQSQNPTPITAQPTQAGGLRPTLQMNYVKCVQTPELVEQPDAVCCCLHRWKMLSKASLAPQVVKASDYWGELAAKASLCKANWLILSGPPTQASEAGLASGEPLAVSTTGQPTKPTPRRECLQPCSVCRIELMSTSNGWADLCKIHSFPQCPGGCNSVGWVRHWHSRFPVCLLEHIHDPVEHTSL